MSLLDRILHAQLAQAEDAPRSPGEFDPAPFLRALSAEGAMDPANRRRRPRPRSRAPLPPAGEVQAMPFLFAPPQEDRYTEEDGGIITISALPTPKGTA